MTNSFVHQNVMRRVRTIHALKSVASSATASMLLFVGSLYVIGREVWVAHVWENMPDIANISAFARFFTYAFTHTQFSVQLFILLTVFAGVWFLREMARAFIFTPLRLA